MSSPIDVAGKTASKDSAAEKATKSGDPGISRKKRRMEWWKKHKPDKKASTSGSDPSETNGASAEVNTEAESERPKLRNRESIAKPDSLKYEPNYAKGFQSKLLPTLYVDSQKKKKKKPIPTASPHTEAASLKRKSSEKSPSPEKSKKPKAPEPTVSEPQTFDSYAFSLGLINGNVDIPKAEPKESKKYVLFIGNLPYDVTREQLEEHFRKTGGIKSIRIPREKGSDMGKGFAYMEFDGRISHGIALRLHQTTLGGRKINVEFTSIGGGKSENRREKLKEKNQKRKNMKRH